MNRNKRLFDWVILLPSFMASGLFISAFPAQSATLTRANSDIVFTGFSTSPLSTQTLTDTDAFTFSEEGTATANSDARALFINDPALAINFVRTEALTDDSSAFSSATGEASIVGDFDVNAGEEFSFHFLGALDLLALVDTPSQEVATATSNILFNVFNVTSDTPVLLDVFELSASISTDRDDDFLSLNITDQDHFFIDDSLTFADLNFGGASESVQAQVFGSYRRTFTDATRLSLVEVKQGTSLGEARPTADIPEPTVSILSACFLVVGLLLQRKTVALKNDG